MDSNRTRLKQASKLARTKSFYEARSGIRTMKAQNRAVSYFANKAMEAQQISHLGARHMGSEAAEKGRLPLSVQYRQGNRVNYQRFGRLENKQRSSKVNIVKPQKQGRQQVVETARNSVPDRADFDY